MTAILTPPSTPAPVAVRRSRGEWTVLAVLLAGTAALYLWDLGASGWANSYYAGAVQAMTQSWKAFFFGSLDAGNVITVDKPPASLWVMAASARIFGFSPWSMLVPQALMGVGTVALIYAAVRRVSGPTAGLVAGAAMALTPVAVLMFRFNNPDALLVLLLVAAAYATIRAIERAGTGWLLLAGMFVGLAFLTKMAQGLVVLPALALAYLVAAPTGLGRRVAQLLGAGVAVAGSAGWWIAIVELWPPGDRPYIGGSQGNSLLELALGYNGLGRILGGAGGPGGPGAPAPAGAGAGFGGEAGLLRMFNAGIGGQVSWLLPAAFALLVIGLWLTRRAPRTDPVRASLLLWGTWTVVTTLVFSLAGGIFHDYYTVALAPGIAALVGIGGSQLLLHRASWPGRIALAAVVAGSAGWAWVLLGRSAQFLPWLRWVVGVVAALAVLALLGRAGGRRWAVALATAAVLTGALGPAAYAVQTAASPHAGSIPIAGPPTAAPAAAGFPGAGPGPGGAPPAPDAALVAVLRGAGTEWSAATTGARSGAELALASGTTVLSIGGFSGSDPAPTLAQFQSLVAQGRVRYFVEGDGPGARNGRVPAAVRVDPRFAGPASGGPQGGPGGPAGSGAAISTWVQETFTATEVGGRLVYDLTQPPT